jgi:hypothetical protein
MPTITPFFFSAAIFISIVTPTRTVSSANNIDAVTASASSCRSISRTDQNPSQLTPEPAWTLPQPDFQVRSLNAHGETKDEKARMRGLARDIRQESPSSFGIVGGQEMPYVDILADELRNTYGSAVGTDFTAHDDNAILFNDEWESLGGTTHCLEVYFGFCGGNNRWVIEEVLKNKQTGWILRFYSTHLTNTSESVRADEASRLVSWIKKRAQPGELPPIVVGDFNQGGFSEKAVQTMKASFDRPMERKKEGDDNVDAIYLGKKSVFQKSTGVYFPLRTHTLFFAGHPTSVDGYPEFCDELTDHPSPAIDLHVAYVRPPSEYGFTDSFENGVDAWTFWQNCQTDKAWEAGLYDTSADNPAQDGGRLALRLHSTGFTNDASCQYPGLYALSPSIPVLPGRTYLLDTTVRNGEISGGTTVIFLGLKQTGKPVIALQDLETVGMPWHQGPWKYQAIPTMKVTAPEGSLAMRVRYEVTSPRSYADIDLMSIRAVDASFDSADNATPLQWAAAVGGEIPDGAIAAGNEADKTPFFIARGKLNGGLHIGKIRKNFGGAHISYAGQEIVVDSYEVLTGPANRLTWTDASEGTIPSKAIPCGYESDGTALYAARASYGGGLHPGKISPILKQAHIPYGGKEVLAPTYQILSAQ